MSASSIIRAGETAYPALMRRLIFVVAALATLGVALYRNRSIDRWELELGIGRHAGNRR